MQREGYKIKDAQGWKYDLLYICQQYDDTDNRVNRAIWQMAANEHAKMKSMITKESTMWDAFLQSQASDPECQAAAWILHLTTSLDMYSGRGVFVQQVSVDRALQKYVPVILHLQILYFSHYLTLARHKIWGRRYHSMCRHFFLSHIKNAPRITIKYCRSCAQDGLQTENKRKIPLFQPLHHFSL